MAKATYKILSKIFPRCGRCYVYKCRRSDGAEVVLNKRTVRRLTAEGRIT